MKTTHIRPRPSILPCLLASILCLLAAAPAAHAQVAAKLKPLPPKPAPFSTTAANDVIKTLDNIAAKYIAEADKALASRDSDILDNAGAAAKAAIEPIKAQFAAAFNALSGDEKKRFEEYATAQVMRIMSIETIVEDAIEEAETQTAPAASPSQPYAKNFPTPEFKTPALKAFAAEYDAYVEESIRLAIETIRTGEIAALDAHFQKNGPEMEKKRETLTESAPASERAPFNSYCRRQLDRNSKAYADAYKASEAHKFKNQAPLATKKNFPTPVFRHAALNDFIREFDAQVDELLRLATEAIQTGDKTKYDQYQKETQKNEDTEAKGDTILTAVRATNVERQVLFDYITDQQQRTSDAHRAVHVPDFRKPLPPPRTTAESIAKVAPSSATATPLPPAPEKTTPAPTPAPAAGSPAITTHPADTAITEGQTATFTAAATGDPAPAYQWQYAGHAATTWYNVKDGRNYSGATTGTLTLTDMKKPATGYKYRCIIKNSHGTATTNPATLTVK